MASVKSSALTMHAAQAFRYPAFNCLFVEDPFQELPTTTAYCEFSGTSNRWLQIPPVKVGTLLAIDLFIFTSQATVSQGCGILLSISLEDEPRGCCAGNLIKRMIRVGEDPYLSFLFLLSKSCKTVFTRIRYIGNARWCAREQAGF